MRLHIAPDLWQALCRTAAQYETCTLRLHQHQGCIKSFTVEHGPVPAGLLEDDARAGTGSDGVAYGLDILPAP